MRTFKLDIVLDKKSRKNKHLKRFYYDSSKNNPIIIEQIVKVGDMEKIISEMRIPLENAPERIREIVNNLMAE